MSSIFGNALPVIRYNSTNYTVPEAKLIKSIWQDDRNIEDESIINGTRRFQNLWTHCEFAIEVHLYKTANPETEFTTLYALNHKEVTFYPTGTSNPIVQDSTSTAVTFFITGMIPSSLDDFNTLDILTIFLKSKTPFDITKSLA